MGPLSLIGNIAPVTITGNRTDAKSLFGVMTQSAEHRRADAPALAAAGA